MIFFLLFLTAITSSAGAPVLDSCTSLDLFYGFSESGCLESDLKNVVFFSEVIMNGILFVGLCFAPVWT